MTGYSTQDPNGVVLYPVVITAVDVASGKACARTRQESEIIIGTRTGVGAIRYIPAVGEQWYVSRYRGEWRLQSRIIDTTISPTQGQTVIGSSGPIELTGSTVNIHSDTFTINGVAYRENNGFQRQNPDGSWETISSAPATIPSANITDSTVLGRILLTAPDVNTVLSVLGLSVAGAGLSGGVPATPNDDPEISGGSVSGPGLGADLDGGTPESTEDIFVTGGEP